jgi:hypothetical protein
VPGMCDPAVTRLASRHGRAAREPSWVRRCSKDMNRHLKRPIGIAVLSIILAACASSQPTSQVKASATLTAHTLAGGCAGTVLTDAKPPAWAQGGFTQKVTPWAVPWALASDGNVVAFLFTGQLVAGAGPRADGSMINKLGWAIKNTGSSELIEARPLGMAEPLVTVHRLVELPTAGCWTFRVLWGANNEHVSAVSLDVLPAGTAPPKSS